MWARFEQAARSSEDRVAISREGLAWTFGELRARADRIADLLRGLDRRPVVLAALPSGPEFSALQLSCLNAEALFVPLPAEARPREAENYLGLLHGDLLVHADPKTAALYEQARERLDLPKTCTLDFGSLLALPRASDLQHLLTAPSANVACQDWEGRDPCLVQFTSGSTGRPKGVLLTQDHLRSNLAQSRTYLEAFHQRAVFCPLPQFHAMGGAVGLEHLCFGSPIHYSNRFDPASDLTRMKEQSCEGLLASPNYPRFLLRLGLLKPETLPTLSDFVLGTAPVPPDLIVDLREAFPEARIHIRYGLSEAMGTLLRLSLGPGETLEFPGNIGRPIPGVDLRIREDEILVRAGSCADWILDENGVVQPLLDPNGYLATGDTGQLTADGQLHLGGRRTSFLKVHGHRIDPGEIEAVLRGVPGIREVLVLGQPEESSGQRIIAAYELYEGAAEPSRMDLQKSCREGLSAYKIPARFVALPTLPRTAAGKPDRQALARMLSD